MELLEEVSNSHFAKVRIKAFASGENAHNKPVSVDALKKAEQSIINKPVTYIYDKINDDASGHGTEEIPCGFVNAETANISYDIDEDGRVFCCVEALIWKHYSGRMFEIFKRDGAKSVSVVITVLEYNRLEDGRDEISSYVYNAITVLGDIYTPAIEDAESTLIEFAKAKQEFENNKKLSKEDNDNMSDNVEKFDKEEFAKVVSLTASQVEDQIRTACYAEKYQEENEDYSFSKFYMRDYSSEFVFAYNCQDDVLNAIPYSFKDGNLSIDFSAAKKCSEAYVIEDDVEPSNLGFAEVVKNTIDEVSKVKLNELETAKIDFAADIAKVELAKEGFSATVTEQKEEISKLKEELEGLKVSFAELEGENVELKEFKSNVEATERSNKIEFAISEVSEDLTQAQADEWRAKADEYESVESFENAIKSFAYSVAKKKPRKRQDQVRASLPVAGDTNTEASKTLWGKLGVEESK